MSSSGNDKRKRKASGRWQQKKNWRLRNPRRGPPGILLTCETGREFKCRREGLEILEYYWKKLYENDGSEKKQADQKEERQSLDEELAALKKTASKSAKAETSPFVEFETGCRGSVFLLSKEAKEATLEQSDIVDDANEGGTGTSSPEKRQRCEDSSEAAAKPSGPQEASTPTETKLEYKPSWEPLELVQKIFNDVGKEGDSSMPGSRFVTRIIPIQVTCFASEAEVKVNVERLLKSIIESSTGEEKSSDNKATPTFAIQSKRRNCGHITRDHLIDWVASQVSQITRKFDTRGEWKVNLTSPDYTMWIEICKTLCGISIVPSKYLAIAPNFNIAEFRDKRFKET